jgi:hypothetical protein
MHSIHIVINLIILIYMATNKPTAYIYLAIEGGKKGEGKRKSIWHKIGAIFKNKTGKGSAIAWDFDPIPTNGRMHIFVAEEKQPDTPNS